MKTDNTSLKHNSQSLLFFLSLKQCQNKQNKKVISKNNLVGQKKEIKSFGKND